MTRTLSTLLTALFTTSLAAAPVHARGVVEDTCVECDGCDPFPSTMWVWEADFDVSLGLPDELVARHLDGLHVDFGAARGSQGQACYEDSAGRWDPITIEFWGPKDEVGEAFAMLSDAAWSGAVLGDVDILYPEPGGELFWVMLYDLELVSYMPLGASVDVSHPGILSFQVTLCPSWGEIMTLE